MLERAHKNYKRWTVHRAARRAIYGMTACGRGGAIDGGGGGAADAREVRGALASRMATTLSSAAAVELRRISGSKNT